MCKSLLCAQALWVCDSARIKAEIERNKSLWEWDGERAKERHKERVSEWETNVGTKRDQEGGRNEQAPRKRRLSGLIWLLCWLNQLSFLGFVFHPKCKLNQWSNEIRCKHTHTREREKEKQLVTKREMSNNVLKHIKIVHFGVSTSIFIRCNARIATKVSIGKFWVHSMSNQTLLHCDHK